MIESESATPQRTNRIVIGAGAGLLLAVLVAGVTWFVTRDDGAVTADPAATTEETIDELIEFVEENRGLEFKTRPVVTLLDDEAFIARYREVVAEDQAENADQLALYSEIYQALEILPAGVTIEEASDAFGEAAVGGFYDPETDELVVRGFTFSPLTRAIVAHELVHALDDQWFELYRPEYDDAADEIGFGFTALVEGNASRIEDLYRSGFSEEERREASREEAQIAGGVDLGLLTPEFLRLQFEPYTAGPELVDAILADGGQEALDAAFDAPPETSEQVLHPDRYVDGEETLDVEAPPADGETVDEGVFGELGLDVVMSADLGRTASAAAAEGWAGDRYVVWNDGDTACIRVDTVMDDESEADALEAGLSQVAHLRTVDRLDSLSVRFDACA